VAEVRLHAVGLCCDLGGRGLSGSLGPEDVQVPDRRERVVEERRAEAGLDDALGAPVAELFLEGGRPLELSHRRAGRLP
jgi:hypothetical protein